MSLLLLLLLLVPGRYVCHSVIIVCVVCYEVATAPPINDSISSLINSNYTRRTCNAHGVWTFLGDVIATRKVCSDVVR